MGLVGWAALAAVVLSQAADAKLDCKEVFQRPWSGGSQVAELFGVPGAAFNWTFHPCEPKPVPMCKKPPYTQKAWFHGYPVGTLNATNPCEYDIFCFGEPLYLKKANGDVQYVWLSNMCVSKGNINPQTSVTINIKCDLPFFQMDYPIPVKEGKQDGYTYYITIGGPCGTPRPFPPPLPPPGPPLPPMPACPQGLPIDMPVDRFTLPLNTTGGGKGEVYYWDVSPCSSTETGGQVVVTNWVTHKKNFLNIRNGISKTATGWRLTFNSTTSYDTAVVLVEKAAGGAPCDWLLPPSVGSIGTGSNGQGDLFIIPLQCASYSTKPKPSGAAQGN